MPRTPSQLPSDVRMKAAGYKLLSVWCHKKDTRAVERIAKRDTVSTAAIVRQAIREFLEKRATQDKSR